MELESEKNVNNDPLPAVTTVVVAENQPEASGPRRGGFILIMIALSMALFLSALELVWRSHLFLLNLTF